MTSDVVKIAKYRANDDARQPMYAVYWDARNKVLRERSVGGLLWVTFMSAATQEAAETVAASTYGRDFPKTFRLTNRKQNAGGQ